MPESYSDRELRYCENVANGMPGTQAAIDAGYAETSAGAQSTRLLKKDKIKSKIAEYREARRVKSEIEGTRIIKEMAAIAFADPTDLFDDNWKILDKAAMKPQMKRAIKSLQVRDRKNRKGEVVETVVTVRMHDKLRALDHLAIQCGLKLDDVMAIAALLKYGDVRRTDTGIVFDYDQMLSEMNS